MRRRGGSGVGAAALLLALLAACEAPRSTVPEDAAPDAAAVDDTAAAAAGAAATGAAGGSILGLSADELLVEVEGGTGRLAIVRKPPARPAVAEITAEAEAAAAAEAGNAPFAGPDAGADAPAPKRPARDLAADRELAAARRELGLALEGVGDVAGAASEFEAALAAGPWAGGTGETPWHDLARICRRGEPAEVVAEACLRAVASARFAPEERASLLAHRGDANARLGRTGQALSDYNAALKIDSSQHRALIGRARLRIAAGTPAQALNDLRLAAETGPRPAEARLERARAFEAMGAFERAVSEYNQVLADVGAAPWEPAAWRGRAAAHCTLGRTKAAAVDWRLWADSVPGGATYLQEMLRARGYLRGPWERGLGPATLAALRAWTEAGCP